MYCYGHLSAFILSGEAVTKLWEQLSISQKEIYYFITLIACVIRFMYLVLHFSMKGVNNNSFQNKMLY